jgi:hypothetical protein
MTIQDYFNRLPEPYRTQAIRNTSNKNLKLESDSLQKALRIAFAWGDSPEGSDYWIDVQYENFPDPPTTESQCSRILAYLQTGKSLTGLEALRKFDCFRLGARIWDLKDRGHAIESELIMLPNGKRVARYTLTK